MVRFTIRGPEYLFSILMFSVVLLSLLIINIQVGIAQSTVANTTEIPLYEITTRGNLFTAQGVDGSGYLDRYNLSDSRNLNITCPDEIAIIIHGWGQNETEAKERFDRVKMSLENNTYTNISLVGFSWDSDTEWNAAKFLAKWNGPKLADFIVKLKNDCKKQSEDIKIRLVGHSLGARVILSTLDSLNKDPTWKSKDFKIASVHLLGAALDNEEVSKSPNDILNDQSNWGTVKSDYGDAIEQEVVKFYNFYDTKDKVLGPNSVNPFPPYQIYPSFEGDLALGQNGSQKGITLPNNTKDSNITGEIKPIKDADGIEAEVFGLCNNNNIYCKIKKEGWDLGLCDLFHPNNCQHHQPGIGDNHAGYIGFRNNVTNMLVDDGAMNLVVRDWRSDG